MQHSLWLGPVIAVAGLLSYFTVFARWPMFRDTAWFNLLVLAVGLALSLLGLRRALVRGGWRIAAAIGSTVISGTAAAALVYYVFFLSYQLPSAEGVTAVGEAMPSVALASTDGRQLDVSRPDSDPTIVVFYRGFW